MKPRVPTMVIHQLVIPMLSWMCLLLIEASRNNVVSIDDHRTYVGLVMV